MMLEYDVYTQVSCAAALALRALSAMAETAQSMILDFRK